MSKGAIKGLLLDMDGVLWRDIEPIGDLPAVLREAQDKGLRLAYVTNNATRTVEQYLEKFHNFGVDVQAKQVYTSARATAEHLSHMHPWGGNVFIIGERGLVKALKEKGFSHEEDDCLAVVVGLDREVNYEKLLRATLLVHSGAPLVGTNPDRTLPTLEGDAPGAGALIAALETATGVKAQIIGKPEKALLDAAIKQLGVKAEECIMVGDRLETDIAAGQKAGCRTALVLSGSSSREEAKAWRPKPDYIEADLSALIERI